jgi:hypothetical protein
LVSFAAVFAANKLGPGIILSLIMTMSARRRALGSANAMSLSRMATGSAMRALVGCAGIHGRSCWPLGFTTKAAEAKTTGSIKGTMIAL